jgi:hypothetical protein
VPTFAGGRCRVSSAKESLRPYSGFLDWSRYYFFQLGPQLYSRGREDPVSVPPLLRKSGRGENRSWDLRISSQKPWPLDHGGGRFTLKASKLWKYWNTIYNQLLQRVLTVICQIGGTFQHFIPLYCYLALHYLSVLFDLSLTHGITSFRLCAASVGLHYSVYCKYMRPLVFKNWSMCFNKLFSVQNTHFVAGNSAMLACIWHYRRWQAL